MDELDRERAGSGKGRVRRALEALGIVRPTNEVRLWPPQVYGALAVFDLVAGGGLLLFEEGFRVRVVGAFILLIGVPFMVFLARLSRRKRAETPGA